MIRVEKQGIGYEAYTSAHYHTLAGLAGMLATGYTQCAYTLSE